MRLHFALSSLALCWLCACSTTPELVLSATPASVPGDGQTPITVTARVTKGGAPSETGTVHFTTTLGRFKDSSNPGAIDVQVNSGEAGVTLLPPRQGRGQIEVAAGVSIGGVEPRATARVSLRPSGALAKSIHLACQRQNVGGLVSGRAEDIHVLCTVVALDASGAAIPLPSVETRAEAGELSWVTGDDGSQQLVYTVKPGATPPQDVDPLGPSGNPQASCPQACIADPNGAGCAGEPCWVDPGGRVHNPRDGVATLIVAAPGTADTDASGEPYVDANDNGRYDPGETFIDVNGNGKYDPGDGATRDRLVWAESRIVWSGEADLSRTPHGSQFVVTAKTAGGASGKLLLNDVNFNALAAASPSGSSDTVDVQAGDCDGGGSLALAERLPLASGPGIAFRSDDGHISAPGLRQTYRQGTDYAFSAAFRPGDAPTDTCHVTAQVSRSYDPGAPGFEARGATLDEIVAGAISF